MLQLNVFFETWMMDYGSGFVILKVPEPDFYYSRNYKARELICLRGKLDAKIFVWAEEMAGKGQYETLPVRLNMRRTLKSESAKTQIIFSDTCAGQFRNYAIFYFNDALCDPTKDLLKGDHLKSITWVWFVSGHSFNEYNRVEGQLHKKEDEKSRMWQCEERLELYDVVGVDMQIIDHKKVYNVEKYLQQFYTKGAKHVHRTTNKDNTLFKITDNKYKIFNFGADPFTGESHIGEL